MSDRGLMNSASIEALRNSPPPSPPMSTTVLMTPPEMAKKMQCSERSLERHRAVGDGPPYVKLGAAIRYPLHWFETWLADRMRHSTSEKAERGARETADDPRLIAAESSELNPAARAQKRAAPVEHRETAAE